MSNQLIDMSNGVYMSADATVLLNLNHYSRKEDDDECYDEGGVTSHKGVPHMIKYWGNDNELPYRREKMIKASNIVGTLLSSKRDLLIGQGITAYRETFVNGEKGREYIPIPDAVQDWLDESQFEERYLHKAVLNYFMHANVFCEFMKSKTGNILYLTCHESKHTRAAKKQNGRIPEYYVCADWYDRLDGKLNPVSIVPNIKDAFNGINDLPSKFMYHFGDIGLNDGYYYHPNYWGGKDWIMLANDIPVFHKHNIRNGYTPRFHITAPKGYFLDKQKMQRAMTEEAQQECINSAMAAQQKFINDFNKFMAGIQNAGRALFTTDDFEPLTREYRGIKIEAIKYDMQDKALLDLFDKSNDANISAIGLPPTLAGINTAGRLSAGSEIRNLLMYFIIKELPRPRKDILKPFVLALKLNGLHDPTIKYTFEDILITKLDENKSGIKSTTENQNPTSASFLNFFGQNAGSDVTE